MIEKAIADNLYNVLLLTGMVVLLILLINNFVFYRRKFKDDISLMIIFCFATCAFELAWALLDGHYDLRALTYVFAIGFTTMVLIFASIFSRFFLRFFNCYPKKKWVLALLYGIPNIAFFLLSVTTPWTHLVFSIDEAGYIVKEILFQSLYYILVNAFPLLSLIVAIRSLFKTGENKKGTKKIIFMLIGFDIVAPLTLVLQYLLLGFDSNYITLSLCFTLALTFLVSNLNTLLLVESEAKRKEIETELKIASRIQESALPPSAPNFKDKFTIALRASMKTAKDVGGDFYDYFPIDDHRICFLIADVSGKGTPAALFMMNAKTVIKDHAILYDDTAKIFTLANSRLCEGNEQTMFATCWIAIFNTETMTLQYTNAGHNYPLLYQKSGLQLLKKVDGTVLGIMKGMRYRSNEIKVEPGDRLLLYTDGVTETHNPQGELYGDDRLVKVFTDNVANGEEETIDAIHNDLIKFSAGADQFDDITMMVITIK